MHELDPILACENHVTGLVMESHTEETRIFPRLHVVIGLVEVAVGFALDHEIRGLTEHRKTRSGCNDDIRTLVRAAEKPLVLNVMNEERLFLSYC